MECTATCRICGVKLTCKDGIVTLGDHLLKKHPEIDINHYVMENCGDGLGEKKSRQKNQKGKLSNKFSLASNLLKKSSTFLRGKKTSSTRKSLYRTTVETWRPGVSPLSCPKCGNTEQPYIRKQRNKVAYNSLGAFFLLGCWPLCFLPMLMAGGGTNTIICCRKCGYCFGTYDKKKGKLIPATKDIKVETPNLC